MKSFLSKNKYIGPDILIIILCVILAWIILFPTSTPETARLLTSTPTVTPTVTATAQPTVTLSTTSTVTVTAQPTITPSTTSTVTATAQPTVTPSTTSTVTVTAQPTVTSSTTSTVTATAQPTVTLTPTTTLTPSITPTNLPATIPAIVSYSAYTVSPDDTLPDLAQRANSESNLILDYNHLTGLPPAGQPLIIPHLGERPPTLRSEPVLVVRANPPRPWVALTLDAGAGSEPVPSILATLRERNIRITFFLTGKWIQTNPELTRQIVADGHEIANHSMSHPDFRYLSSEQMLEELATTEALMQETAGVTTRPFFRPPYGAYDEHVLLTVAGAGYLPIYWTLDSLDSVGESKTPEFLLERVTGTLPPEELAGAILLAHCGSEATAQALPAILDRFAMMGFEVRTLGEVLGP